MPPPRIARRGLAALALAALVAAACSGDGDAAPPEPVDPVDLGAADTATGFPEDWQPPPLEWSSCDLESPAPTECATLEVPLDWDEPDGATVELALARIPARGERMGTVVTNPGGPGASGVTYLASDPFGEGLGDSFDQVSWDPRGVGASDPLECSGSVPRFLHADPAPDDEAERTFLERSAAAVAADCGRADPDLLAAIGTSQVVRDLEAIRLALGGDDLDYVGLSYGSQIGLGYAAEFGDRIRTMVLDGVVDPTQGFEEFLTAQAVGFEVAFDAMDRECAEAGIDECGVDDLGAAWRQVAASVEEEQLPAAIEVGPAEVATAVIAAAYVPDGWVVLGPALADALDGDGAGLSALAASYLDYDGYDAYAGVVCTDSPPPRGVEAYRDFIGDITEAAPRLGSAIAAEMLPCATWPVTAPPAAETPLTDAPGMLLVAATGDPATPIGNARAVAARLPDSRLVEVDSAGHVSYGSDPCATRVVDDYVRSARLPEGDLRC